MSDFNAPTATPKQQWPDCRVCGEPRGEQQKCRNGCDTWTANNVGTTRGQDWMDQYTTRGGPRGGISETEK